MFGAIKKHLNTIQNSDDATKKRWLIGASAVAMVLVVGGWLVYMDYTISKAGSVESDVQAENATSFWQIFKTGLSVIGSSIKEKVKNLISDIENKVQSENMIIIEK